MSYTEFMESLKALIKFYFPDENILRETTVKLSDTWTAKVGKLPFSSSRFFYKKPMPMIETDNKYYFDKRVPLLYQSLVSIVLGPLSLMIFFFVIQVLTHAQYPMLMYIAIGVLGIIVGILNTFINKKSLLNIYVLDKAWITETYTQEDAVVLKGTIPMGKASYFFYSHIPEEKLSKKVIKKLPVEMSYDTVFTIKYKIME